MTKRLFRMVVFALAAGLVLDPASAEAFSAPVRRPAAVRPFIRNTPSFEENALSVAALWVLMSSQRVIAAGARETVGTLKSAVSLQVELLEQLRSIGRIGRPYLWLILAACGIFFMLIHFATKSYAKIFRVNRIKRAAAEEVAKLVLWHDRPLIDREVLDAYRHNPKSPEWRGLVRRHLRQALARQRFEFLGPVFEQGVTIYLLAVGEEEEERGITTRLLVLLDEIDAKKKTDVALYMGMGVGKAILAAMKMGRVFSVREIAQEAKRVLNNEQPHFLAEPANVSPPSPEASLQAIQAQVNLIFAELESWKGDSLVSQEVLAHYQRDPDGSAWRNAISWNLSQMSANHGTAAISRHTQEAFDFMVRASDKALDAETLLSLVSHHLQTAENIFDTADMFAGWHLAGGAFASLKANEYCTLDKTVQNARDVMHYLDKGDDQFSRAEFEAMPYKVRVHADISKASGSVHSVDLGGFELLAAPLKGLNAESTQMLERMAGWPLLPEGMAMPAHYYLFGQDGNPFILARMGLVSESSHSKKMIAGVQRLLKKKRLSLDAGLPGFVTEIDFLVLPHNERDPEKIQRLFNGITAHFKVRLNVRENRPRQELAVGLFMSSERADLILGMKEQPNEQPRGRFDEGAERTPSILHSLSPLLLCVSQSAGAEEVITPWMLARHAFQWMFYVGCVLWVLPTILRFAAAQLMRVLDRDPLPKADGLPADHDIRQAA